MATNTGDPRRMRRATRRDPDRHHEEAATQPPRLPVRGTPANENEPTAAAVINNIKRRPSATPFWVAFAVSLAWIFACAAIYGPILLRQGNLFATSNLPQLMTATMVVFLPIGLAWTSAYLLYRAQQLRQVSEALMQTAMRLVRPQDIAAESLSSVAQTVREEVNLLVDGVEQAVTRATQLEELVHKEMAAIERAFGGNEERIRNLISGLEAQREALHQAGFVIGTEATPLLGRLEENTQHLDGIINAAQGTLAALEQGLKTSTTELAHTIDEVAARAALVGDQISSQTARMEQMSSVLLSEVQGFSDHITNQVETLAHTSGNMNLGKHELQPVREGDGVEHSRVPSSRAWPNFPPCTQRRSGRSTRCRTRSTSSCGRRPSISPPCCSRPAATSTTRSRRRPRPSRSSWSGPVARCRSRSRFRATALPSGFCRPPATSSRTWRGREASSSTTWKKARAA